MTDGTGPATTPAPGPVSVPELGPVAGPSTPVHPTFSRSLSTPSSANHTPTPRGPPQTPNIHASLPSPIFNRRAGHGAPLSPDRPQYAEDLTPLKLRQRRKRRVDLPEEMSALPLIPGVSKLGWLTEEGEVYRGAKRDPRGEGTGEGGVDEDAVTLASTSSSSSGWSLPSEVERVFERFGEVIGVRRGSRSSGDTDSTISSVDGARSGVFRRRTRRLSRTTTRDSSPERPKRQHLPRKREFTLLLPPKDPSELNPLSRTPTPRSTADSDATSTTTYPSDRLVVTPSLPTVLERIRNLRAASGIRPETPTPGPEVPISRGGSAPGRTRQRTRQGYTGFAAPTFSRPPSSRTGSRLHALRGNSAVDVPRPKSVSDLMNMANPYSSQPNLPSLRNSEYKMPTSRTPAGSPTLKPETTPPAEDRTRPCWWLNVSCPTWEDLRDIGELLGLHPLTLEDVLQQDPREKLDTFVKLGYYFVAVRALDEGYFKYTPGSATTLVGAGEKVVMGGPGAQPEGTGNKKEGRRRGWGMGRATGKMASKEGEKVEIVEDNPGKEGLEGVGVGAFNVYMVVFADGIVSVSLVSYMGVDEECWLTTSSTTTTSPNTPNAFSTVSSQAPVSRPLRVPTGWHTVSSIPSSTPSSRLSDTSTAK